MTRCDHRTTELLARTVFTSDRRPVGSVVSALVDAGGTPRYIEVRRDRFERQVKPIPVQGIEVDDQGVVLPHLARTVEGAPAIPASDAVTYDVEVGVCRHFDIPVPEWVDDRDAWRAWRGVKSAGDMGLHLRSARAESGMLAETDEVAEQRGTRLRRIR